MTVYLSPLPPLICVIIEVIILSIIIFILIKAFPLAIPKGKKK